MLPAGHTERPLTVSSDRFADGPDVDLAVAVVNAAETALPGGIPTARETVRAMLTSPEAVRDESRLFLDPAGVAVGLLFLERESEARRTFVDAYAIPQVAAALYPDILQIGIAAARRSALSLDWELEAAAFEADIVLRAALAEKDFEVVRRFWRMRIVFDTESRDHDIPAPAGVTRRVVEGEADRRQLHELFERSFGEHFGFTARPFEDWISWFDQRRDARPDLMWIAESGGKPVGLCIADDSRIDEGLAYIRTLGVVPEARGRGIARWLLAEAFAQARTEGRRGAALAVDSSNVTGATALYESVGMSAYQVIDVFRRPL